MNGSPASETILTDPSPSARQPNVPNDQLPLERLFRMERTAPDAVCFVQPFNGGQVRSYTWREALDEVRRIASWLKAQRWPAGSRIGILGKNSAGWILSDWAIWMAGHVSVPIYPLLVAANVQQILNHSGAVACFVGKLDDLGMLAGITSDVKVIALPLCAPKVLEISQQQWEKILLQSEPLTGEPVRHGRELASIVYTSGTTGTGKGVMYNFEILGTAAITQLPRMGATPEDRVISYLPLAHVVERLSFEVGILYTGARIYFTESLETFTDDLRRARPTIFVSVPRLWLKFQQGVFQKIPADRLNILLRIPMVGSIVRRKILKGMGLDAVTRCYSGTAAITTDLLAWWDRLGLHIIEGYGMTELTCVSHSCAVGGIAWGTVGKPVDQVDHRIDPVSGEVQVLSPVATLGYYREPELTRELFTSDGWLRTGDKGIIDAQGRLHIVGRLKDNFKSSKGKYVAPGPIEGRLALHAMVDSCLVMGANLAQPIGLVVINDLARAGLPQDRDKLEASFSNHLDRVNRELDPHEQLDCLVLTTQSWTTSNGMLTPTMKARRPQIENRYASELETWLKLKKKIVWAE